MSEANNAHMAAQDSSTKKYGKGKQEKTPGIIDAVWKLNNLDELVSKEQGETTSLVKQVLGNMLTPGNER